jgi:hypothetical protein
VQLERVDPVERHAAHRHRRVGEIEKDQPALLADREIAGRQRDRPQRRQRIALLAAAVGRQQDQGDEPKTGGGAAEAAKGGARAHSG